MRHRIILAIGIVLLGFAAAGCSGDGNGAPAPGTSEDELARSLLLTIDDFGDGWVEVPTDDDDDSFSSCAAPGVERSKTGEATTETFLLPDSLRLQQFVTFFSDASAATDALESREIFDCWADVINSGGLDADGLEIGDATVTELAAPNVGEQRMAARIRFVVRERKDNVPLSEAEVFLDIVRVRIGRVGVALMVGNASNPADRAEWEDVLRVAVKRVEDAGQ